MNDKNIELFVYPINGYGWEENGKPIESPNNFHIKLRNEKDVIVIEKNHIFDNLRIQITQRHIKKIDLSNSIADFYSKRKFNLRIHIYGGRIEKHQK